MRGELTAALLHDPSILLLDEPTIGLDVISKEAVREFLVEINREQGTTVLLTTHDLVDVERLCERLLIIDHGLRDRGRHRRRASRRATARERTLVVDLVEPGPPLEIEGAAVTRVDGPRQWLRFRRDDVSASELLSRVTRQVGGARPVRGGTGHREHRAGDLRSVTMRTRPLTLAAVGLVAVAIDMRVVAWDLLPDVLGWLLVAFAAWRLTRAVGRRPRARRVDRQPGRRAHPVPL